MVVWSTTLDIYRHPHIGGSSQLLCTVSVSRGSELVYTADIFFGDFVILVAKCLCCYFTIYLMNENCLQRHLGILVSPSNVTKALFASFQHQILLRSYSSMNIVARVLNELGDHTGLLALMPSPHVR